MNEIPKELLNEVCHTTTLNSFLNIYETGFILINPDSTMLEYKKYGNVNCPNNDTYVRSLGGISVFDFKNFSIKAYDRYVNNTWEVLSADLYRFLPNHIRNESDGLSVWIVIDTTKSNTYRDRNVLYEEWQSAAKNGLQFIPKVEATFFENIPVQWVKKVCIYDISKKTFQALNVVDAYNYLKKMNK